MNNANMDTLIAFLTERNEEERFDIGKFHHTCGTPSCIIGWCYTLHTGNDKVPVEENALSTWNGSTEMLRATQEYLNIEHKQAYEIACGWEDVRDWEDDDADGGVWVDDPIPFETVVAYLNALKDDQHLTWQEFYDDLA